MARNAGIQAENNFVRGLITEATALNFPENAVTDTNNCRFGRTGVVYRRLGIDAEQPLTLTTAPGTLGVVKEYKWDGVGNDGDKNFLVIQFGAFISFYEADTNGNYSGNEKAFSVPLSSYKTPETNIDSLTDIACSFSQGNGYLFIAHPSIDPIYIEYDEDTDTITVEIINIQIRDINGLEEDGVANDFRPSTLTNDHHYNLLNQGWAHSDEDHFEEQGIAFDLWEKEPGAPPWPSNADIPWYWRNEKDQFDGRIVDRGQLGNSPAPRGYYILDAFNLDRSSISGVSVPTVTTEGIRPNTIAFFAGRVWYLGVNYNKFRQNVYFSKIIEDKSDFDKCYQVNDPTSVELSDLLDSDGGLIKIPDMGQVYHAQVVGNKLFIFSSQGVWSIGGSGEGTSFIASDFSVNKISDVVTLSSLSFISVDGTPMWWNLDGIYTFQIDQTGLNISVISISRETIDTFIIENIPPKNRLHVKGDYDRLSKTVQWLFRSNTSSSVKEDYEYDRILVLDTVSGAFYPWTVDDTEAVISGIFSSTDTSVSASNTFVLDNADAQVQNAALDDVVVDRNITTVLNSKFKYISRVDAYTFDNADICVETIMPVGSVLYKPIANDDPTLADSGAPPTSGSIPGKFELGIKNTGLQPDESSWPGLKIAFPSVDWENGIMFGYRMGWDGTKVTGDLSVYDFSTKTETYFWEDLTPATMNQPSNLTEPQEILDGAFPVNGTDFCVFFAHYNDTIPSSLTPTQYYQNLIVFNYKTGTIVDSILTLRDDFGSDDPTVQVCNFGNGIRGIVVTDYITDGKTVRFEYFGIDTNTGSITRGGNITTISGDTFFLDTILVKGKQNSSSIDFYTVNNIDNIIKYSLTSSGTWSTISTSTSTVSSGYPATDICELLYNPYLDDVLIRDAVSGTKLFSIDGSTLAESWQHDYGTIFSTTPLHRNVYDIHQNIDRYIPLRATSLNGSFTNDVFLMDLNDGTVSSAINMPLRRVAATQFTIGYTPNIFHTVDWTDGNTTAYLWHLACNTLGEIPLDLSATTGYVAPDPTLGLSTNGGYMFSEEFDTNYIDWSSVSNLLVNNVGTGVDYTSYFTTGQKIAGNLIMNQQANYITVFSNVANNSSCYMNGRFDFSNSGDSGEWSTPQQVYTTVRPFRDVVRRRLKVRGAGPALNLHFTSESGKPFFIIGWSGFVTANALP